MEVGSGATQKLELGARTTEIENGLVAID